MNEFALEQRGAMVAAGTRPKLQNALAQRAALRFVAGRFIKRGE